MSFNKAERMKEMENVFNQIGSVYNLLMDDQSKEVFMNRVLYNITKEKKYIDRMANTYFLRLQSEAGRHLEEVALLRGLIGERKVVIYGIGNCGFVCLSWFTSVLKEIKVEAFCDRKADKISEFYGYPVVKVEDLRNKYEDCCVLITPVNKEMRREITSALYENGITEERIIELPFSDFAIRGQYFDDVVPLSAGEVFVDAGCFDCGSSIDFIRHCVNYEKIIAFEPNSVLYKQCTEIIKEQNISKMEIYNMGLWDKKDYLAFSPEGASGRISKNGNMMVELAAMDEVLSDEKVTYVKMDVEGAELKALQGMKEMIMKQTPKLAICVYHKPGDIIEIPAYIHGLVPEYKFYMRHYSVTTDETVLYAIIE